MSSEWQTSCLGDFVELQRGTTYKSSLLGLPGPFLLGLASIRPNGGFRDSSLRTYGGASADKLILKPGDIYVSLKDVTQSADLLGAVSQVPPHIAAGRLTQDTVKLTFKNDRVPSNFIYWLLRTPGYREYCRAHSMGTTNLSLSRVDFLSFAVPEPTAERLLLVTALESIDARINLNRQINQTLEQMAPALFQAWFVDFEPVKAKVAALADGRDPLRAAMSTLSGKTDAELDELPGAAFDTLAATAALFPEEMEESVLGAIPKGWTVKPLDSIADYLNGLALQKYPLESPDVWLPVIKISQLKRGDTLGADRASANLRPEYIIDDGDVVFSWSGSLEVAIWCGGKGALNQHLFKVTSRHYPKWFYYLWTKQHLTHFQATAAGKAVTMGHIQRKHLTEALCVAPPKEALDRMGVLVADLLDATVNYRIQARSLATLRDSLLPKLLSGELAVTPEEQGLERRGIEKGVREGRGIERTWD